MKSLIRFIVVIILISNINKLQAQIYFSEGFEGGLPTGWTYGFGYTWGGDTVVWKFQNGGYSYFPEEYTRHPYPAHGGTKNAVFQREGGYVSTKLVSKSINLSYARKPYLKFWHAQDSTYFMGNLINDELKVYYRKTIVSPWILLAQYTQAQKTWIQRQVELPPSSLTNTYYIAFEGKSNSGFGTCIDDIEIIETDTFPKTVQSIEAVQNAGTLVLTGSTSNPVMRLNIFIIGNTGTLTLDSLALQSLNTTDNDVYPLGVKLYSTIDTSFKNPVFLAQTSFISSKAIFDLIDFSLKMGNNYLWVTYDVKDAAGIGDTLDLKILANSIKISDKYFPKVNANPSGFRKIVKSAFYDDFETDKGWVFSGDFQHDVPGGLGKKYYGNADPSVAVSGSKIIGTDITTNNGDYPSGVNYSATSVSIDCRFFKNTKFSFMRWLNVNGSDNAKIEISNDGGLTWIELWKNPSEITDNIWKEQLFDIAPYADRKSQVIIRFKLGPTGHWPYSGWNIDNFAVYGDYLVKDVGVTEWLSPLTDCGHTSKDSVKVTVKNFAGFPATNVPIIYSFDGTQIIHDTIKSSIPSLGSTTFTFKTPKDLSTPIYYNYIYASTQLTGDQDPSNNLAFTEIAAYPTYNVPFEENFDTAENFWTPGGDIVSWQLGNPVVNPPASYPNSYESYIYNNEDSYVKSPCVDIHDTSKIIIEFKYNSLLQTGAGVAVYYSTDKEATWKVVPKHSYPWKWNWYNNNSIDILGNAGWDTTTNNAWLIARQVLPSELKNISGVKFKIVFKSPFYGTEESFAFDDFKIYEAPANIKLNAITSHVDTCIKSLPPRISFTIQNNGIRTLIPAKDTVFAFLIVNSGDTVSDTLFLRKNIPVNGIDTLTFKEPVVFNSTGPNSIKVFISDKNYGFYPVTDRDTLSVSIDLYPNPTTALARHISATNLNTLVVRAFSDTANYIYNWANSLNASLSKSDTLFGPPEGKVWLSLMKKSDIIHRCTTTDTILVNKLISNITVDSILYPVNSCELGDSVIVKLSLKNVGTDTIETGDSIMVAYKFENQDTVRFQQIVNKRFFPRDTLEATFINDTVDMSNVKTYAFTAFSKYRFDSVQSNDTVKRNITVWGLPSINLGPDATVPGIATLHAGPGFDSYLWCDGSTDSIYSARFIGYHWVDVFDSHGCKKRDSIDLKVVFYDIIPDTILSPLSSCVLGSEKLKVRIKNIGTDTIDANEIITLKYKINQGLWYSENYLLIDDFLPDSTLSYTFSKYEDFGDTGKYTITLVAKTTDVVPENDTIIYELSNYGNPEINLGNDTTIKALSYVINAKPDNSLNYIWKNNLTGNNYLVTRTDTVNITATNKTTSCFSRDTIKITLSIKDGLLMPNAKLYNACYGTFDSLKVRFVNAGSEVIPSGDTVWFWYKIGNYTSAKSFSRLLSALNPGDSVKLIYKDLKDKLQVGNSQLLIYSELINDLRTNNNKDTIVIQVLPIPPLNLTGFGVDTVITTPPYILKAPVGAQYSYNWQDGSHNDSYSVTSVGSYFVQVIDNNNTCINYDTVFVDVYIPDGGITYVVANTSVCEGEQVPMQAWFKNSGSTDMKAGEHIYFDYEIKSRTISELYTLESNLKTGDSVSFTFSNIFPDLSPGLNKIKVFSVIGEDINPLNDTVALSIINNPLPNYNLAGGQDTAIFNYGEKFGVNLGFGYSYVWNTGSTLDSIYVTKGGKYSVLVTNKVTSCHKSDSVFIKLDLMNGGITEKTALDEYCYKTFNDFDVSFENTGNTTILQGETINFSYILNQRAAVTENEVLSSDLYPGGKVTHTFSGFLNIVNTGVNNIKTYSYFNGDAIPDDDTLSFTVTINALPVVSINNMKDTIFAGLPLTLDAGEGDYTYKWQNGNTGRTCIASNQGYYNVAVTDNATSCTGYDTVFVFALHFDGGITAISANTAACMGTFDHFDATFTNKGEISLRSGDSLKFAYKINNGSPVIEGVKLISDILKGGKLTHTFNNMADKVIAGTNNFKVFSIVAGDTNAMNDTMSFSVKMNTLPIVEIGDGKDTIYETKVVVLTGGVASGYTYKWQDESSANTFTVTTSGKYYVKVTNNLTNCYASDTVIVIVEYRDAAVTAFTGGTTGCLGKYGPLSIEVTNQGNLNIDAGDTIYFGLKVNGTEKIYDNVKVTTALLPNQKTTYTIPNADNYLSLGTNLVKAYAIIKNDSYLPNDTATKTIQISNYPTINLAGGNETLSFKGSYILDAGSGFSSYLWNTAAKTQSINITSAGWYKVTVSNSAGCKSKDSVYMKPNVGIDQGLADNYLIVFPNPATESVTVEIKTITLDNPVVEIFDMDKKLVYSRKYDGSQDDLKFKIDLNNFPKGIYLIRVSDKVGKLFVKKLIIK